MENIIGHEKVKIILSKIINENKIGHAYMFVGKDGIGKKMVAEQFAKEILKKGNDSSIEADFKIIYPDKDMIKVEEIRNIISDIYLKPVSSEKKVVIIDDADKMNASAQNALLKVLEEPPLYAVLILIVSNKEKIISTILSRVTEIAFNSLTNDELKKIVGKDIDYEYARGSAKKALEIVESSDYETAKEMKEVIDKKDFLELNRKMTEVKKLDTDIIQVLETLKIMFYKSIKEDTSTKVKNIDLIENTIKNLRRNANTDLTIDKLMIEICKA